MMDENFRQITDTDQLRIQVFLKHFGCNQNETLVYLEIVQRGPCSIQEVARKLGRNRLAVYYNVEKLIEKSFIFEIRKGKKRLVAAEDASVLYKLIEKQHEELKSLETELPYIIKLLNSVHSVKHEVTVVKVYEDVEGFKKLLDETLHAKSEIVIFSNTPVFSKMLGDDYYENYFHQKAELGIKMRIIYPPSPFAEKLYQKRNEYKIDLRIFPQNQLSESGFYIWNDTLAINSFKDKKGSCTLIENKDIAQFFRDNIFDHFWQEAKDPSPKK